MLMALPFSTPPEMGARRSGAGVDFGGGGGSSIAPAAGVLRGDGVRAGVVTGVGEVLFVGVLVSAPIAGVGLVFSDWAVFCAI